jgi:hypothetical protein
VYNWLVSLGAVDLGPKLPTDLYDDLLITTESVYKLGAELAAAQLEAALAAASLATYGHEAQKAKEPVDSITKSTGMFGGRLAETFNSTAKLNRAIAQVDTDQAVAEMEALGKAAEETRKKFEKTLESISSISHGVGDLVTGVTDVIIASYQAQEAAGVELTDGQKRAANAAAIAQKVAAAQMILVDAAIAFAGIVANLSVYGPVVAFGTAASVVGVMLSSLAGVIKEPLPFPAIGWGDGGKQGVGGEPGTPPTDVGSAPGVGDNYKNDSGWGDQWGGAGAGGGGQASRSSGGVTVTLSRTAGQLLRVAPAGKTTRGMR